MTEDQIERQVERMVDRLDQAYLATRMTQEAYGEGLKRIDAWAKAQLRFAKQGEAV